MALLCFLTMLFLISTLANAQPSWNIQHHTSRRSALDKSRHAWADGVSTNCYSQKPINQKCYPSYGSRNSNEINGNASYVGQTWLTNNVKISSFVSGLGSENAVDGVVFNSVGGSALNSIQLDLDIGSTITAAYVPGQSIFVAAMLYIQRQGQTIATLADLTMGTSGVLVSGQDLDFTAGGNSGPLYNDQANVLYAHSCILDNNTHTCPISYLSLADPRVSQIHLNSGDKIRVHIVAYGAGQDALGSAAAEARPILAGADSFHVFGHFNHQYSF